MYSMQLSETGDDVTCLGSHRGVCNRTLVAIDNTLNERADKIMSLMDAQRGDFARSAQLEADREEERRANAERAAGERAAATKLAEEAWRRQKTRDDAQDKIRAAIATQDAAALAHLIASVKAAEEAGVAATAAERARDANNIKRGVLGVQFGGLGNSTGVAPTVNASDIKSGVLGVEYGGTGVTSGNDKRATYCRVVAKNTVDGVASGGMNTFGTATTMVRMSANIVKTGKGWDDASRTFVIPFGGVWEFAWNGRYESDGRPDRSASGRPVRSASFKMSRKETDRSGAAVLGGHFSPTTSGGDRDGNLMYTAIINEPVPAGAALTVIADGTPGKIFAGQVFTAVWKGNV